MLLFSLPFSLNSFSSKSAEQTSPKHKPVVRDDSPIRNKEAYYGGPHYHTPVREQSPQPDIPLGYRQSPVVSCENSFDEQLETLLLFIKVQTSSKHFPGNHTHYF